MKLLEFILNDIAQPRAQATRELVRELTCYMPESFFYFGCWILKLEEEFSSLAFYLLFWPD